MKRDSITIEDILYEIDMAGLEPLILNGDVTLDELLDDPSAWLTAGRAVRLGIVFKALGEMLEAGGKEMAGKESTEDCGVQFDWVNDSYNIDDKKVKMIFNVSNHPELYKKPEIDTKKFRKQYPKDDYLDYYVVGKKGYTKATLLE